MKRSESCPRCERSVSCPRCERSASCPRCERFDAADAVLVGLACAPPVSLFAYASLRIVEQIFFPEPSPAIVVWSEQSPVLWRAAIALYVGGAGVFGGFALARRSDLLVARALRASILLATTMIVVQAAFFP